MIDDDAWPEPIGWSSCSSSSKRPAWTSSAARCGPISKSRRAVAGADRPLPIQLREDGRVAQIHAAGNFLARATIFRAVERPWFSNDYALTGGEDDDFFLRLKELGYSFAQSTESIVYERMPPRVAMRDGCASALL